MREIRYTSDSHLSHTNIIKYTRRPFAAVAEMDLALITALRLAEQDDCAVVHAGDLTYDLRRVRQQYGPIFQHPERHRFVAGNHDSVRKQRVAYEAMFGDVVGDERSWKSNTLLVDDVLDGRPVRILVSHLQQPDDVLLAAGVDYNVYGHIHNNLDHSLDYHIEKYGREVVEWTILSERHLNACVELTGFQPLALAPLIEANTRFREMLLPRL